MIIVLLKQLLGSVEYGLGEIMVESEFCGMLVPNYRAFRISVKYVTFFLSTSLSTTLQARIE